MTVAAVLLLVWGPLECAQTAPEKRGCVVEGVVVDAATQQGLAGVGVQAVPVNNGRPHGGAYFGSIGFTIANGAFRIEDLPPDRYLLRVISSAYAPARRLSPRLPALEAGQTLRGLRLEMLPFATVSGRVLDDNGDPVSGASVELRSPRQGRLVSDGGAASTNDRGEFLISRAQPGRYLLAASHVESRNIVYPVRGGGVSAYVTTFLPGVSDPEQAQWLELSPGSEQSGLEIQLRREAVFRVRGVAQEEGGAPVPRFVVSISNNQGMLPLQNRTFQNGLFEIEGLRPGTYSLLVRSVTMGAAGLSARVPLTVGRGEVENLQIRLAAPVHLRGTAVFESETENKPDWTQVTLAALSADGAEVSSGDKQRLQADGSFSVDLSARAAVLLRAEGQPAAGAYLAEIRDGGEARPGGRLDLSMGSPGPLRLVFRTGAAQLTGRVENERGPATDGCVGVAPAQGGGVAASASVNYDGSFSFPTLPPGDYLVFAVPEDEAGPEGIVQSPLDLEARAARVHLAAGGKHTIRVKLPAEGVR